MYIRIYPQFITDWGFLLQIHESIWKNIHTFALPVVRDETYSNTSYIIFRT